MKRSGWHVCDCEMQKSNETNSFELWLHYIWKLLMLKGIVNIHPLSSIIYIVPKSSSCYKYLVGSDVFGESWEMGLTRLLLRDAAVEWNQFLRAMTALHTETIDAKRNSVNSSSINHNIQIVQSTFKAILQNFGFELYVYYGW